MAAAATRMRRYRARQKAGRRVVPVEVTPEIEDSLVRAGWLDLQDLGNRTAVGEAVAQLLRWFDQVGGSNVNGPFDTVTGNSVPSPTRGRAMGNLQRRVADAKSIKDLRALAKGITRAVEMPKQTRLRIDQAKTMGKIKRELIDALTDVKQGMAKQAVEDVGKMDFPAMREKLKRYLPKPKLGPE